MHQLPDFDELVELANKDPQALEAFRQASCQAFIDSTPSKHHQRLQTLQFRLEREIRTAKTPLAGLLKLSNMMHDSFHELTETILALKYSAFYPSSPSQTALTKSQAGDSANRASVIDLQQWKARHQPSQTPQPSKSN